MISSLLRVCVLVLFVCAATAACTSSTTSPGTTSTAATSTTATTTTTTTSTTVPPNVSAVTPNIGPNEGGNTVTITGTGFTSASAVMFNDQSAASFTVVSDATIKAVTPPSPLPGGPTVVDIFVTTPNGTSVALVADHFTFTNNLLNRFTLSDSSVHGGTTVVGTAAVQYVAPVAGYTLPVTWSSAPAHSTAAIVPASVRIEPGFITGAFAIQTTPVTSQQCYLIGVTFPPTGAGATAAFCVVP